MTSSMTWDTSLYDDEILERLLFIALNEDPSKGKVSSARNRLLACDTLLLISKINTKQIEVIRDVRDLLRGK